MADFELTQDQKWWIQSRSKALDLSRTYLRELLTKQQGLCALSGVPLKFGEDNYRKLHPLYAELDHCEPGSDQEGHQIICGALNRAKGPLPYSLFQALTRTDEWKDLMERWRVQAARSEEEPGFIEALNGLLWPKP